MATTTFVDTVTLVVSAWLQDINDAIYSGIGISGKTTVASATTPDIFAATIKQIIDYTGTATCTGFVAAPAIGSRRVLVCAAAAVFTAGATMIINGVASGSNFTAAANDKIEVIAVTTTLFHLIPQKANGFPVVTPITCHAGGRLTLTTVVPVLTASVTGATTVYYTPYLHRYVPIYDGTNMLMSDVGAELSQTTADSTKSPAAVAASSNYDVFVWNDSGTYRATRGPAWTSGTARGTGAGTTELQYVIGVLLNKVAITNGPAANRGTYVGTIGSNASSTIDFIFGAVAASGTAGVLNVWNMYNRVSVSSNTGDSTDSWTYTTATWRSANNSNTMRCSFVLGLNEDTISASYGVHSANSTSAVFRACGIGLDSTSAIATGSYAAGHAQANNAIATTIGRFEGLGGLGTHYVQALEYSAATGTTTWYGDNANAAVYQNNIACTLRM